MSEPLKSLEEIVDKLRDIFIGSYSWPAAKVIVTKELYEWQQSTREDQRKKCGEAVMDYNREGGFGRYGLSASELGNVVYKVANVGKGEQEP